MLLAIMASLCFAAAPAQELVTDTETETQEIVLSEEECDNLAYDEECLEEIVLDDSIVNQDSETEDCLIFDEE